MQFVVGRFKSSLGLLQISSIEAFYGFIMKVLCLKIGHYSPQLFGSLLQRLFPVKLQQWFVDYKTSLGPKLA